MTCSLHLQDLLVTFALPVDDLFEKKFVTRQAPWQPEDDLYREVALAKKIFLE